MDPGPEPAQRPDPPGREGPRPGRTPRQHPRHPRQPGTRSDAAPVRTSSWQRSGLGRARQQQDAVELRRRKAREWDDVLAEVRALAGFEHFLAAIPYAELAAAAADGPVVIVNASRYGCHALIVDPGSEQPRVVNLPA